MRLTGARVARTATEASPAALRLHRGRVLFEDSGAASKPELDLGGYLILPGLINAHDHLEFNLFPRLGEGP